ncbi:hypothetical protein DM02DRAFT_663242 [Periconia macrospinosa]|uniref:Uncharacterized protein n=1 Tax=Periconia macrospinosa TaxID=97972 RepID=A0A2V1D276_9PLEO|nr:hypothetical protein DM02DRAFT_663242 [Periconia macrospinosa]
MALERKHYHGFSLNLEKKKIRGASLSMVGAIAQLSLGLGVIKLQTIRSTHTQRLHPRDAGGDPQDTILKGDTIRRSLKDVSTATVELGLEPPVKAEYGSDRGLIITGGQGTADGGP